MIIKQKKDAQQQYAVVRAEMEAKESYRVKMILNNHIERLADCYVENINNEEIFYYKLPQGFISLAEFLEKNSVEKEFYKAFFFSLAMLLESMKEYLLRPEELLLDKEAIFLEKESLQFLFLYFPLEEEEVSKKYTELSEVLLRRMDCTQKDTIELGYLFYQNCMAEKISVELLYEMAKKEKKEETEKKHYFEEENFYPKKEEEYKEGRDGSLEFLIEEEEEEKKRRRPFFQKFRKRKEKEKIQKDRKRKIEKSKNWKEDLPRETEEETLLMESSRQTEKNVKAWLIPKENFEGESIALDRESYIIGKSLGKAELQIDSPRVSRIHARLRWNGRSYELMDLGSKNGSRINQRRLEAGKEYILQNREEVCFADRKFIYYKGPLPDPEGFLFRHKDIFEDPCPDDSDPES